MPYAYVRGYLAHAGKVFEGLNPVNVMAEIVRNTEVNFSFSDVKGKRSGPAADVALPQRRKSVLRRVDAYKH